jgi:hypothetical protein
VFSYTLNDPSLASHFGQNTKVKPKQYNHPKFKQRFAMIDPVIFTIRIGGWEFPLRWYGVIVMIGVIVGSLIVERSGFCLLESLGHDYGTY